MTELELIEQLERIDPNCELHVTEPNSDGVCYYVVYLSIPVSEVNV